MSESPEMLDMFPDIFNPGSPGPFEKCVLQDGHALIIASDGLWDAFSDDDAGEEQKGVPVFIFAPLPEQKMDFPRIIGQLMYE